MTEVNMSAPDSYDGARRPGTVGFLLDGINIRIADRETGSPVVQGEVRVIDIRGRNRLRQKDRDG